jgi:hypothetical protein
VVVGSGCGGGGGIAFTSGTGKLLSFSFTQTINPASDFTLTTGTGLYTYTGSVTRYFKIDISYSLIPQNTTNSLQFWVTKNGSLTAAEYTLWNFYVVSLSTPDYAPSYTSRILQLANNDTVQFAGLLNGSSSSVDFKSVKITINALS